MLRNRCSALCHRVVQQLTVLSCQVVGITSMCGRGSAGVSSRHSSHNPGSVSQEPLLAVQRMDSTTSRLNRTTWCLLGSCVCPVCWLGSYIMACRRGCVCSVSHHLQSHFGALWGRSCLSGLLIYF
ncbi:hypothetical protein KC19_VG279900 [Ceratodon purpureus]|uniref:Uncharacterized protein n=1 Tax=Ceratodon purpureus TaxID=3225 RepID=A0A8T0HVB4_CERPU|nr:hypothetical protein KC19_VG279900 [Ceratodon purpureus]